jgi:hypothetical protein
MDEESGVPVARRAGFLRGVLRVCVRRPADALGCAVMLAIAGTIIANALFYQHGPDPMLTRRPKAAPGKAARETTGSLMVMPRPRPIDYVAPAAAPASAPVAHEHPQPKAAVAVPIKLRRPKVASPAHRAAVAVPNARVTAVQRALSDYGYGQIKVTGILDSTTRAAMEKFEREHKMHVTGQISDRLLRELTVVTGRRVE